MNRGIRPYLFDPQAALKYLEWMRRTDRVPIYGRRKGMRLSRRANKCALISVASSLP